MEENIIKDGKTNIINDINNKICKILENNLISNLIIIFIGLIASAVITGTVLIFMNNKISRLLIDSEYFFSLLTPFKSYILYK